MSICPDVGSLSPNTMPLRRTEQSVLLSMSFVHTPYAFSGLQFSTQQLSSASCQFFQQASVNCVRVSGQCDLNHINADNGTSCNTNALQNQTEVDNGASMNRYDPSASGGCLSSGNASLPHPFATMLFPTPPLPNPSCLSFHCDSAKGGDPTVVLRSADRSLSSLQTASQVLSPPPLSTPPPPTRAPPSTASSHHTPMGGAMPPSRFALTQFASSNCISVLTAPNPPSFTLINPHLPPPAFPKSAFLGAAQIPEASGNGLTQVPGNAIIESEAKIGGSEHSLVEIAPCDHFSAWKRLRGKKGFGQYVCLQCGVKWKTSFSYLGLFPQANENH